MKADIVTFPACKWVFKFKNTDTIKLYKRISRLTIQVRTGRSSVFIVIFVEVQLFNLVFVIFPISGQCSYFTLPENTRNP